MRRDKAGEHEPPHKLAFLIFTLIDLVDHVHFTESRFTLCENHQWATSQNLVVIDTSLRGRVAPHRPCHPQ